LADREVDDISQSELNAFFGESKYPQKFLAYERNRTRFAGFNIWAAIFTTAWFFYRRLYVQGIAALVSELFIPAIVVLLVFFITEITDEFAVRVIFSSAIVCVRIAVGYWGNLALFKKAKREVREIDKMNFNNDMHLQMVTGAGATNIPAFLASFWIIGILDRLVWTGLV
jgi:hypothetical protein